jgi:hypothetical protein
MLNCFSSGGEDLSEERVREKRDILPSLAEGTAGSIPQQALVF